MGSINISIYKLPHSKHQVIYLLFYYWLDFVVNKATVIVNWEFVYTRIDFSLSIKPPNCLAIIA
jgi:hypothetical protein